MYPRQSGFVVNSRGGALWWILLRTLVRSAAEDHAGLVVPRWRVSAADDLEALEVLSVCLAPWRRAPGIVVDLLMERVGVERSDLVVDLGSGDGCVLVGLASRTGCTGIGIEASAGLVARSRREAGAAGVADRVIFLHELIGCRGLRGASLVYCWLLPGSSELVRALVEEVLVGGGNYRGLVVVGEIGDLGILGSGEVIGEIPDRGRIRSEVGLAVRWLSASSRPLV